MSTPIKPNIEREGQPYVHEPVYVDPRPKSAIEQAVASALGTYQRLPPIQVGWHKTMLRWLKPDGTPK